MCVSHFDISLDADHKKRCSLMVCVVCVHLVFTGDRPTNKTCQNTRAQIYFLYPQLRRRPRARSNLRPFERTYGRVCECGTPGALPKCLFATRAVRWPCTNKVPLPVGARTANWSKVNTSPPFAKMRPRAFSVTCKAHNLMPFGTRNKRMSSVTVPTTTTIFSLFSPARNKRAIFWSDSGGLLVRLINRRFNTILLNFLYVRRYKKRYNYTEEQWQNICFVGLVQIGKTHNFQNKNKFKKKTVWGGTSGEWVRTEQCTCLQTAKNKMYKLSSIVMPMSWTLCHRARLLTPNTITDFILEHMFDCP